MLEFNTMDSPHIMGTECAIYIKMYPRSIMKSSVIHHFGRLEKDVRFSYFWIRCMKLLAVSLSFRLQIIRVKFQALGS